MNGAADLVDASERQKLSTHHSLPAYLIMGAMDPTIRVLDPKPLPRQAI